MSCSGVVIAEKDADADRGEIDKGEERHWGRMRGRREREKRKAHGRGSGIEKEGARRGTEGREKGRVED